jgi:hypothetical protein
MTDTVQIRFRVNGEPTPWETEYVRNRALGQTPTAVARITELRQCHPTAAIAIERRGDTRPEKPPLFRFSIYVKEGTMPVNDPEGVGGVSVVSIHKQTLFSRPFTDAERDIVRARVLEQFPDAELTEVRV